MIHSIYAFDEITEDNLSMEAETLDAKYQIYLACANDGRGYDITRQGELLKTFDEWLNS